MVKKLSLIIALVSMSFAGTANAALPENSLYVEGLGNGILYSLNYERVVMEDFGLRLGYGAITMSSLDGESSAFINFIPLSFNWMGLRSDNDAHMLELGAGATVAIVSGAVSGLIKVAGTTAFVNSTVGYRFQGDSFQFRVGVNPLFNFAADTDAGESMTVILPYISFGAGF